MPQIRNLRVFVRVALPVAVAAVLVCLAFVNVLVVKTWVGHPEDGVLLRYLDGELPARKSRRRRCTLCFVVRRSSGLPRS
jgi:hypothetical protein